VTREGAAAEVYVRGVIPSRVRKIEKFQKFVATGLSTIYDPILEMDFPLDPAHSDGFAAHLADSIRPLVAGIADRVLWPSS
jgi:hypothetical protein